MNKAIRIVVIIAAVAAIGSVLTVQLANAVGGPATSSGGPSQANGFGCAGGPGGKGDGIIKNTGDGVKLLPGGSSSC